MLSFTATALEGGADRAAESSVASIVSSDCRSVSSQSTVRASNVVTPKTRKKMTNVPESPPRTVEDLWQRMLLRDGEREEQQRQRDEQRDQQWAEQLRQRDGQRDQQWAELVRQVTTLNQQVQALVGSAGGGQRRDSPSHRHRNSGSCCDFFFFRYRAHRHQGAVETLDQDEQNILQAMGEPLETTTNRQEALINADVFMGPAGASLASSTEANAGSQRLSASPSQGPASRGSELSSDGPDGNPASVSSGSSPPPLPPPVLVLQ